MIIADSAGIGAGIAIAIFLWFAIAVGALIFMIFVLIDIVRRPEWQWKLARQEKVLWILLVILVNFLAIPSFIYWFNIRKKLRAVEEAAANGAYGPGHMTFGGWEPLPAPPPAPAAAPAGWYADTSGQAAYRYWDGARWTDHTSAGTAPVA